MIDIEAQVAPRGGDVPLPGFEPSALEESLREDAAPADQIIQDGANACSVPRVVRHTGQAHERPPRHL